MILKRFLFEAFDAYIALFYLAFYELDMMKLKGELVSLYTADAGRRVVTESLLPLLLQKIGSWQVGKAVAKADGGGSNATGDAAGKAGGKAGGKAVGKAGGMTSTLDPLEMELNRDQYEQFDDYLEMVIEFGYVTLFASAFPLAAALSVACNMIEIRSDIFKLSFVCQRPKALRANNIGTWRGVVRAMAWCSILTNVFIFGRTSEQMMVWFPSWFNTEQGSAATGNEQHFAVSGAGRWVMGFIFGVEHVLIIVAVIIMAVIPSRPGWVRTDVARRAFEEKMALRKAHYKQHDMAKSVLRGFNKSIESKKKA